MTVDRLQRIADHFAGCERGYGFGMHRDDVAFLLSELQGRQGELELANEQIRAQTAGIAYLNDERAHEERRASALILDLRATITRLMGELQAVTSERDELRDMRKMGYELRLKQAIANIAAERKETA